MSQQVPALRRERLLHLDALRGLAIVLMVLDHARVFFGDLRLEPEHVASTTPALFATRWVTHLCAPTFVFLAGVSVALAGRPAREQLARGAWLVLLEVTLISLAWTLQPALHLLILQVIAAIGAGLIAVAAVQRLPRWPVALAALAVLAGHDALAGVEAADLGPWSTLWMLGFEPGRTALGGGWMLNVLYPIVPWAALLVLGWAGAGALRGERTSRRRRAAVGGAALLALFALLRALNGYGDPAPWSAEPEAWRSVVSFLNVSKYPPSLDYLALTLGAAGLVLAAFDRAQPGPALRWLACWGRAPLFAYVAHLYLLHVASMLLYALELGRPLRLFESLFEGFPEGYGHGLSVVYAAWLACLALLARPVRRWGELKRSGRSRVWHYL